MQNHNLRNDTVKGAGWAFGGSLASYGITFVIGVVLARILGPEEYGLVAIITIFITVFNGVIDGGFTYALIRKEAADDVDYNTAFYTNMGFSAVLYAVLFFCAPAIADFFNDQRLVPLSRIMGVSLFLGAASMVQRAILSRNLNFRIQTRCTVLSSAVSGVVGVIMAVYGYGVWALAGQQITQKLIFSASLWFFNRWLPGLVFSLARFREMWSYGWKLVISDIVNNAWGLAFQSVIGRIYTPSTLGFYSKSREYVSMASSNITSVAQRVSFPALSKLQNDDGHLREGFRRVLKVMMLITFSFSLGLAGCSRQFILILIGEKWLPCVAMMQIISFELMLYPLQALNLNILHVKGRSDMFLALEVTTKCIQIIPILIGAFVGIHWMLISNVAAYLIASLLIAHYAGRFIDYKVFEQLRDIAPSFLISMCMGLCVFAMSFIKMNAFLLLPIQIVVGAVFVIVACRMFELQEYSELREMAGSIKNRIQGKCQR